MESKIQREKPIKALWQIARGERELAYKSMVAVGMVWSDSKYHFKVNSLGFSDLLHVCCERNRGIRIMKIIKPRICPAVSPLLKGPIHISPFHILLIHQICAVHLSSSTIYYKDERKHKMKEVLDTYHDIDWPLVNKYIKR